MGAVRRGEFLTGIAIERVTERDPNRKLVLNVLPAMHELVLTGMCMPHMRSATSVRYNELRVHRGTERIERTSGELRLDPVPIGSLIRWVAHKSNARVLAHFRYETEQKFRDF